MQKIRSRKKYFSFTLVTVLATAVVFAVIAACSDQQAKARPNLIQKDPPKPGLMAKIGGQEITDDMLIGDERVSFFELKKKEYDLRMDRLNRLMVEILVGAQAKKSNMSLEDFVNKKVIGGEIKISDHDYKKFVTENVPASQVSRIDPGTKAKIINYLQSMRRQEKLQAYVAKLTKANPVEVYFKKPRMNLNIDTSHSATYGGANAPVTVVEFSDFQCPFCGRAAKTVEAIKKKYGNRIKFVFENFPLPMHQNARPAAEAGMCVKEQGMNKFWKFHDLAFGNQDKLDPAGLENLAKQAGANVAQFKACVGARKYSAMVDQDIATGQKIGVQSTPTFFINGTLIAGAVPMSNFVEVIDDELASAKK